MYCFVQNTLFHRWSWVTLFLRTSELKFTSRVVYCSQNGCKMWMAIEILLFRHAELEGRIGRDRNITVNIFVYFLWEVIKKCHVRHYFTYSIPTTNSIGSEKKKNHLVHEKNEHFSILVTWKVYNWGYFPHALSILRASNWLGNWNAHFFQREWRIWKKKLIKAPLKKTWSLIVNQLPSQSKHQDEQFIAILFGMRMLTGTQRGEPFRSSQLFPRPHRRINTYARTPSCSHLRRRWYTYM